MANTATAEATAPAALPAVLGGVAPYLFIAGAAKASGCEDGHGDARGERELKRETP